MKLSWHTEKRKLSELIPSEYNPRKATEKETKDLAKSLERFSLADPIIINTDNHVVGGHFRLRVLKDKGEDIEVDVRVPNRKLTDKEERELNIRLNKNTGQFNYELLANFDEELLLDTGFESVELDKIFQLDTDKTEDDFDADAEAEKIKNCTVKIGDIYQLGDHVLMCGDATSKEDVEKLMGGEKADMVFTDPPYGMNLDTDFSAMKSPVKFYKEKKCKAHGNKYCKVINDDKEFDPTFIMNIFNYCKEQFWFGADYYSDKIIDRKDGSWIVWDKRLEEKLDRHFGSCFELCYSKKKHRREIARIRWAGIFGTEKEPDKSKSRIHPTQKPVTLVVWFIEKFSKRGNIIVDVYGGSGSTLIACEQTNRKCRMMEIDPLYVAVITKRFEDFTGKKAVKL